MFLLKSNRVLCSKCYNAEKPVQAVNLHQDNVLPYKQTCHECNVVLVVPRTPVWPELYPKRKSSLVWMSNPNMLDLIQY